MGMPIKWAWPTAFLRSVWQEPGNFFLFSVAIVISYHREIFVFVFVTKSLKTLDNVNF